MSAVKSEPPPHHGYLIYTENPKEKTMILKTLLAEPEAGSGLGLLLMWLMADMAKRKTIQRSKYSTQQRIS